MSDTRTAPQGNGAEPQATTTTTLPDDVLSRIVEETERQFTARAARPSPIHLRSWEEIERFAERAARSGMVPRHYIGKPDAICIAIQMGAELGLSPMMALKGIAVINGIPSVYGDVAIGLCRQSGKAAYITEGNDGRSGDNLTYWCEAKRKDDPNPVRRTFSVADAKTAHLWDKAGPWKEYPQRMLAMRARGFALRDAFPDVLEGLITVEEAQDYPFEATGLTLPPVATEQPITPQPAQAPTPAQAPPNDPAFAHLPLAWQTFMSKLRGALDEAQSEDAVTEISTRPTVSKALTNGPQDVPTLIQELLADAWARFKDAAPEWTEPGTTIENDVPPELRAKPETPG